MTELREQLGDGIALDPDAPQPPFPVWMSLPARWSVLDTNPGTWRRSADVLIDTTFRGARLSAAHRRDVLGVIEGLVADVQASGACISLIVAGRRPAGGAATLGLHIAFGDDGAPASLAHVAGTVPRAGTRTELSTPVGPALLQRERMTMAIPGTATLAALTSLQVFIPIPDTTWTAVIATACAFPELTDRLERLLVGVAGSFRLTREGDDSSLAPARGDGGDGADAAPAAEADDADSAAPGYRAVRGATGPGIERGFRTMVVKRLGDAESPAGPASGPRDRPAAGRDPGSPAGPAAGRDPESPAGPAAGPRDRPAAGPAVGPTLGPGGAGGGAREATEKAEKAENGPQVPCDRVDRAGPDRSPGDRSNRVHQRPGEPGEGRPGDG